MAERPKVRFSRPGDDLLLARLARRHAQSLPTQPGLANHSPASATATAVADDIDLAAVTRELKDRMRQAARAATTNSDPAPLRRKTKVDLSPPCRLALQLALATALIALAVLLNFAVR